MLRPQGTLRISARRHLLDRSARWMVTAGGLAIIAGVLGVLLFILLEVRPLLSGARVAEEGKVAMPGPPAAALLSDEYRESVAALGADGRVRVVRRATGEVLLDRPLLDDPAALPLAGAAISPGRPLLTAATADGRVAIARLTWQIAFEGQVRTIHPEISQQVVLDLAPSRKPPRVWAAHMAEDGTATAAGVGADGALAIVRRAAQENPITGETTETRSAWSVPSPRPLTALVLDAEQRNLFAGAATGELIWWPLSDRGPGDPLIVEAGASPITALTLLIGYQALVIGRADGSISVWFNVRGRDGMYVPTRIRDFPAHQAAVRFLAPSFRDKGFLALDVNGGLGIYHSTSHRTLWTGQGPVSAPTALALAPKGDGAFIAGDGRVAALSVRNPHPEISLSSLFGKVWYEGYDGPAWVWQSSGATDDSEPKLSLAPLAIGTLKGTFYSLVLAIPLAVLGAMYTSQFMHPALQRYVKPAVEIMAALPSVVLGFIAGLWLAPRLEIYFPALILMGLLLPAGVLAAGWTWERTPRTLTRRLPIGTEVVFYMVVLGAAAWLALLLREPFSAWAFGGDFQARLLEVTGLRYDQRNAVVVGIAMGFAVIPIIFAIAEDAFSNVPKSLISGSLALGASRWQTVTRVVLPTASPGIFSAVMIGFGRAVGETMIVLMATGNTPILDWSPFNGFRTFSANIAVEIPEAPQGGSLYRTLFLAALLLFILTFVVNTAAELVRHRLRRRYAHL